MGEATTATSAASPWILAALQTASTAASIGGSAVSTHKGRKFQRKMYAQQREDSLKDTADARAYAQLMYDKYETPTAKARMAREAGFSPLTAIGESSAFNPPAVTPNSDTSTLATNDASLTEGFNNNVQAALNRLDPLSYFQAQNLLEDARAKKMDNDQKEKENDARDRILDIATSPDDFPQLYHYDEGWFKRCKERLGHQPTFRDMMTMAIAKQYVHQANATAGHHHDNGLSGFQFEALSNYGAYRENFRNGRRSTDNDSTFMSDIMSTLEDVILENTSRGRKLNFEVFQQELQNEWLQFYNDNQKEIERAYKTMKQVDADYYIAEKWLEMINNGVGTIGELLDMIPQAKVLKLLSRYSGKGSQVAHPVPPAKRSLPSKIAPRNPKTPQKQPKQGKNTKVFDFSPYE